MKQVFLSGQGEIEVFDAPVPGRLKDGALIRNSYSVISSGTEGAAVTKNSGVMGIYEKASASRDRVEQVWRMVQHDGLLKTYSTVSSKLKEFSPIGYSSAGTVVEADGESFPFQPGDRVACMGAGLANHAEYVAVPRNLLARIPDGVPLEEAAFASIACIALQGIRRLELTPGESIGVIGLGLIGQIAVRLLAAMGHEVYGADLDPRRVATAGEVEGAVAWASGETDSRGMILERTGGRGLDGVVVCAATDSDEPVNLAFDLLRMRGRVSVVGDVGLGLDRAKMYRKELELRLSCSYGPGRYDNNYELQGQDYPLGYVRWTEGRNLEYFLHLLGSRRISLASLVSARFPVSDAKQAYAHLKTGGTYAVVLDYGAPAEPLAPSAEMRVVRRKTAKPITRERIGLGVIGIGSFARGMHLPNAKRLSDLFDIRAVASRSGGTAAATALRYDTEVATSDHRVVLDDKNIDAVLICTRHATHARFVMEALEAGKHVFVEKPMTTTVEDGQAIVELAAKTGLVVRVGFNRRFAPMMRVLRDKIGVRGPRIFQSRVNIGALGDHWSNTPEEGGRFLGEATHFLDLCNWFAGGEPMTMSASFIDATDVANPDAEVVLRYPDGSLAQVLYTSLGSQAMGKEYFEAFGQGRSGRLDDYRSLALFGVSTPRKTGVGEKGQLDALREFGMAVRGQPGDGADARAGLITTWMALEARRAALENVVVRPPF